MTTSTYMRESGSGNVPDLPILAHVKPKPKIKKIELEGAFATPYAVPAHTADGQPDWTWFMKENGLVAPYVNSVHPRLSDFEETRLEAMDETAIEYCMSAPADPAIQAFKDPKKAQEAATKTNDYLASVCKKYPDRFGGWASVSLHDGAIAAEELRRCIKKLGMKGCMVNGFQQTQDDNKIIYLDDPSLTPFWEALVELDVPLYIHPRVSHQRLMYENHPEMQSAMWGFASETGTHMVRIIYAGIFDRFPTAQVVIGHMGENVPYMAWRIQHFFQMNPYDKAPKMRIHDYLARNIWITTSGNYDTAALLCAINVCGSDRILFSVDYPFENCSWAADWIETCPISESDRQKICYDNAVKLLKLRN